MQGNNVIKFSIKTKHNEGKQIITKQTKARKYSLACGNN